MSEISKWFKVRRESKAIKMMKEHAKKTLQIIKDFREEIKEIFGGNIEEALRIHNRVELGEKEQDSLRRLIITELARGELPPSHRGDLMRLARRIDWIIDWVHEASRIMKVLSPYVVEILKNLPEMKKVILKMIDETVEAAAFLFEAVSDLSKGEIEETLNLADKVERREEAVDALYEEARKIFAAIEKPEVCTLKYVLLLQFVDAIENTADKCEMTCDQIRATAVSMA